VQSNHVCWIIVISIVFSCISINVQGEESEDFASESVIVHLLLVSGSSIQNGDSIHGFVISDELPVSVWWRLIDSETIVSTGEITGDLSDMTEIDGLFRWNFEFTPPQSSFPCSCNVVVSAIDKGGQSFSANKLVFLEDGFSTLSPIVNLDRKDAGAVISDAIEISGSAFAHSSSKLEIGLVLRPSSSPQCSSDPALIFQNREAVLEFDPGANQNGQFDFSSSLKDRQDGSVDAYVFSNEIDSNDFSHQCMSFFIDNTAPTPVIIGPSNLNEGSGLVDFQCTESFDSYWADGIASYFWTLKISSELGSVAIESLVSEEPIPFVLDTNFSGSFEISLTVTDKAGNYASTAIPVHVNNTPPSAVLLIGDTQYFDGDTVAVNREAPIILDASESKDTPNDISTLRYIWRVGNVPFFEGSNRDLTWPDNNTDTFELTLEVIDNDHESTVITIQITDEDSGLGLPLQFIFLFASIAFLTYAISRRSKEVSAGYNIPKWPSNET